MAIPRLVPVSYPLQETVRSADKGFEAMETALFRTPADYAEELAAAFVRATLEQLWNAAA